MFKVAFLALALSSTLFAVSICTDKQGIRELKNQMLSMRDYMKDVYCQGDTIYMVVEVNSEFRRNLATPQGEAFLRNKTMPKWCGIRNQLISGLRAERGINYTAHINVIFTHQGRKFREVSTRGYCS